MLTLPGKTAIQYGAPGRSASSGQVATVFGCTGFLGRYVVAKLGALFQFMDQSCFEILKIFGISFFAFSETWNTGRGSVSRGR